MTPLVVLIGVEIDFPNVGVVVVLDKRIVVNGSIVLFSEKHRHAVPPEQSMADGLTSLASYLALNGWPNISSQDRATLLNTTNAARGASEQSPINQL